MTGNLARRIQRLEGAWHGGKQIIAVWRGPQDDEAVTKAERESERTGRPILVVRIRRFADAQL